MKKLSKKILIWLLTAALIIVLIPLSVLYAQTLMSTPKTASEEGQTTSIRAYAFIAVEEVFLLDVEHRVYTYYDHELDGYTSGPIVVPQGSCRILGLTFEVEGTLGGIDLVPVEALVDLYDIFATGIRHLSTEASVEVPRMPSGCAIGWIELDVDVTTLTVNATFVNESPITWTAGRPLVRVNAILVDGVPDAVVVKVSAELSEILYP